MQKFNLQQFGIDIRNFIQGEKIGLGGYSDVYSAQYRKNGEDYAAKVVKSSVFKEEEKKKIENEIEIMSQCDHPTVIKYFGYSLLDFNLGSNIVIFTELIKNGSLSKIISKAKQLDHPENYDNTARQIILIGISSGMRYLHHHDIMHCDLKPNNVLLDDNYYPHIIDFGMAKYIHKKSETGAKLLCGTLPYMAPEMILGKSYSNKIDVYAFAMIMYEVICETDLYPNIDYNHSLTTEFKKHVAVSNKRPQLRLGIKSTIKYLIQRCWSAKVTERPSFDEIYNKLIDPQYYLDNVDEKRVKEYINYIAKNDIYDNNKSELIEKVRNLSKENDSLKEQIKLLKEDNEKLSNENKQMKEMIDDMTKSNDSKTIKPPPLKDENFSVNSRFLHLKDKKENEIVSNEISTKLENTEKDEKSNLPRRPFMNSKEEEIKERFNLQKRAIMYSKDEQIKQKISLPKKPTRHSDDDQVKNNYQNENRNDNNEGALKKSPNKEKVNGQTPQVSKVSVTNEKKDETVKLPSLNKMKKNEPISFNEFNSFSLKQQQLITNLKVNSMGLRSKNQYLVNLQTLLNSIIQFVNSPETSGFIEIEAENKEDKIETLSKLNQITILYKTTETLYYHHLLDKSDFKEILRLFKDNISIEIKYITKTYQGMYDTVSAIKYVFVSLFISGIKKTDNTFKGNQYIDSIRFDSSVKSITDYAFKNCSSLTKVDIPSTVTSIGSGSFEGCESLKSISIPYSITFIDFSLFKNCSNLVDVSLPNSIKLIRDNAFYGCSSLKKISLPSNVSSIGDFAFYGCSSLESVSIPSSVTSIGKGAFGKCSGLKNVSVPSSVKSIGKGAFGGCNSLEEIKIPSSIKNLNELDIKPESQIIQI